MAEPVNPLRMSERPAPLATPPSDADRAADDGFPSLPEIEEAPPISDAPSDPERLIEALLHEEPQDERAPVKSR